MTTLGVIKGDTRSLDYSSCRVLGLGFGVEGRFKVQDLGLGSRVGVEGRFKVQDLGLGAPQGG